MFREFKVRKLKHKEWLGNKSNNKNDSILTFNFIAAVLTFNMKYLSLAVTLSRVCISNEQVCVFINRISVLMIYIDLHD